MAVGQHLIFFFYYYYFFLLIYGYENVMDVRVSLSDLWV
jgi:hypothetical protein